MDVDVTVDLDDRSQPHEREAELAVMTTAGERAFARHSSTSTVTSRSVKTEERRASCHPFAAITALGFGLLLAACSEADNPGRGDVRRAPSGEASSDATAAAPLTPEQLQDPLTCKPCHAQHFREWQSSMHAYAAKAPVFIAMNERGQQETGGELGDFCVRCHAPLALELGLTRDGLNLPDLTHPAARGVTCYFCHNTTGVLQDHNQHLQLARDGVMYGGIRDPVPNDAHFSNDSPLQDGRRLDSASLCGSCHDVVNHRGVAIERTFAEWRKTRYATEGPEQRSCGQCHMPRYTGRAASDSPERELHRHMFAAVDLALEKDFPGVSAQKAAIDCAFEGAIELSLRLAADGPPQRIDVQLTNRAIGHSFPSGAAQDRRAWVELVAYDAKGAVVYKSGVVADGEIVDDDGAALQVFRDRLYDEQGDPVHMFWEAAPSASHPLGYESNLLAAGEQRTLHYDLPTSATRVTARLQLRAMGLEVLDDFQGLHLPISERVIDTGYLDDGPIRSRFRTLTVPGTTAELRFGDDPAPPPAAAVPTSECSNQAYVSLLPAE